MPEWKTKLGIHHQSGGGDTARWVREARPSVLKMVGDFGPQFDGLPGTLVLGRMVDDGALNGQGFDMNRQSRTQTAAQAADEYVEFLRDYIRLNPLVSIWEGPNEQAFEYHLQEATDSAFASAMSYTRLRTMQWYAEFLYLFAQKLSTLGKRAALGGWAVGNPAFGLWGAYSKALQATKDFNAVLTRHEYGPLNGNLSLRYRQDQVDFSLLGYHNVPVIISECGADNVQGSGPWKTFYNNDVSRYWNELLLPYTKEIEKDDYVIGATVFTSGGANWRDFDITGSGLVDLVVGYANRTVVNPSPVPPARSCLVGLHGRADGRMQAADWHVVVDVAKIEAVKLLSTADPIDASTLKAMNKFTMVRLFEDFRGRFISPGDFVTWQINNVSMFRSAGVHLYEIHNEPNLIAEGLGTSWSNGEGFSAWFSQVYKLLKAKFPDCYFGFPGVSPGATISNVRMDEWTFLNQCKPAIQLADFMCQHVYWQTSQELTGIGDGVRAVELYRALAPNKTLFITEFSNQSQFISPTSKAAEYVRFYAAMKTLPYVGAAFAFVASASSPEFRREVWRNEDGSLTAIPAIVGNRNQSPPPIPPVIPSGMHRVNSTLLNVRTFPWTGATQPPSVYQLSKDGLVRVLGIYKTPGMEFGWGCLSNNSNEWVSMKFLVPA
jgi:hypothetical protein